MNTVVRIVPAVVVVLGLAFITIGMIDLAGTIRFRLAAEEIEARVVGVEVERERDTESGTVSTTYRPTFTFTTADGSDVEATSPIAHDSYDFETGETVAILYDPAAPEDIRVAGFVSAWLFPLILTIFGLFTMGMGLMARRVMRT